MSAIDKNDVNIDAVLSGIGMLIISFILFFGNGVTIALISLLGLVSLLGIRNLQV